MRDGRLQRSLRETVPQGRGGGRDQLLGALVIVLVIAYQVYTGDITVTAAKAEVSKWSVLTPHLIIIGVYLLIHAALTARRMDREWQDAAGLPLDLFAFGDDGDRVLRMTVTNRGDKDTIKAEIEDIQG